MPKHSAISSHGIAPSDGRVDVLLGRLDPQLAMAVAAPSQCIDGLISGRRSAPDGSVRSRRVLALVVRHPWSFPQDANGWRMLSLGRHLRPLTALLGLVTGYSCHDAYIFAGKQ